MARCIESRKASKIFEFTRNIFMCGRRATVLMQPRFRIGVTIAVTLLFVIFALTPIATKAKSASQDTWGYALYANGNALGVWYTSTSNGLTVKFKPAPDCSLQIPNGGTSQPCPKGANKLEVNWIGSGLTSCAWAQGKKMLSAPCSVPSGGASDLFLNNTNGFIKKVFWTLNGHKQGKTVKEPGANSLILSSSG
jgi:hypothetical protein